jgi:hypothetical protein
MALGEKGNGTRVTRKHTLKQDNQGTSPTVAPEDPAPDHGLPGSRNVRPKRENRPHRNVKTWGTPACRRPFPERRTTLRVTLPVTPNLAYDPE